MIFHVYYKLRLMFPEFYSDFHYIEVPVAQKQNG